jgi:asparagine synthase (glutamine-hydrolysing)
MSDAIAHRGPDDEGYFFDDGVGFGFRRLSIIDLGGGHQPMSDTEKTVWVIFNGEIYNFAELKHELESHGHRFRTRSDTEVIVHGYKQWGTGVFDRLHGMFGIALWDVRRRRLVLARDAMGIKLVYYAIRDGSVWFGSEIRAVVAGIEQRPAVDPVALNLFLRYRYTPSPLTILDGIRKLPPGGMLVFEDGAYREERWYQFRPQPLSPEPTDNEAAEELLAIYRRAVRRHLISDVPVGLLLSGGVDSGLLLGLMGENGGQWRTFTVGYGETFADDELADAEETARLFGGRHTSVRIGREQFDDSLTDIVRFLEEPIAASSIVPMFHVSARARQDVKVALIGQGPDELFGGYKRHLGVQYAAHWRSLPPLLQRTIRSGIRLLPRNEMLKRGARALDDDVRLRRYQSVFSLMPGEQVDALFQPGLLPQDAGDTILSCWSHLSPALEHLDELSGLQWLETGSSLPDELLMYSDKLSMAHGLEVRVPYLDREVVEYAQQLTARFKIRHGVRKWLHKRACDGYLPRTILRRKKRGFAVNIMDQWFREGTFHLERALDDSSSGLHEYFVADRLRDLIDEHRNGREDHHKILSSLTIFTAWLGSAKANHAMRVPDVHPNYASSVP